MMIINKVNKVFILLLSVCGVLFLTQPAAAHHPITAKFDTTKEAVMDGVVTKVDWRNPHVHVFFNVTGNNEVANWAIELESKIILKNNGWDESSLAPGDHITVQGLLARNGSRQIWGDKVTLQGSSRAIYSVSDVKVVKPLSARPAPRWPDGTVALGASPDSSDGYWSFPSEYLLVEDGAEVESDKYGLLTNIEDVDNVAPFQPWALGLFKNRQQRQLQEDPMFLNCKPPGGPRQFQSDLGVKFVEDKNKERIFVLMGSGNHNYRIIYMDDREQVGQVTGDDDNPLYYGRSAGRWEGDTLVVDVKSFNEDFWLSNGGLPHTNRLELEERYTRTDLDTLVYEVTINDPGAYTRPWTASWTLSWVGEEELPTHFCQENRP